VLRVSTSAQPRLRTWRLWIPSLPGWAWRFFLSGLTLLAGGTAVVAEPVDFARDIRPLLNKQCTSCHGGVKRAAGVSFLSREGALAEAKSGGRAIVPGDVEKSELLKRVTSTDQDERMPPADHGPALSAAEVAKLREWIRGGAVWTKHWAYEKPVRPALPKVKAAAWPRQALDSFVLARLEAEKLNPSPEAGRLAWLRRVSFDLTGLPPSEAEARDFLADNSSQAFERVADRLLASPSFGERWASVWLDLARYADTVGYERDFNRVVWPWRDWVVRAFNSGLGYDELVVRQLAGDLLPDATDDDRLATAFHRNTQANMECGSDDEEFRLAAVIDRIGTTWEGFAGTSFRCVQCHDHPYDPFTHEEFYRFAALFNTTRDNDSNEDFPVLRVAENETDRARLSELEARRKSLRRELHAEGMALAAKTAWQPLRATEVKSTGQATMALRDSPDDGAPEVLASGTITLNSVYTVDFPRPAGGGLTALRLEVRPDDEAKAVTLPELGFVLSRLQVQVVDAQKSTNVVEISLATAYDEDPDSFFPAESSIDKDAGGWSAHPRFHRRRTAVFVTAKAVVVPPDATLRIVLSQDMQASGTKALALRRIRFAVNSDESWSRLLETQNARLDEVKSLQRQRDEIPNVKVPVIAEQPASQHRETRVFLRGNWLTQGAAVAPGVPQLLGKAEVRDRLEMARWLTSPEHPLFARVAVNRFWEQLFGLGLVESSEEFGTTGMAPSHPELLDWLAVRFATELGFSPKRLLREIVLSATYRQDAKATRELLVRDPRNRLLARGPRQRLTAEMIRDQVLAVSGLLSAKLGGPTVMPRQPEGIWRTVYNGGKWVTSPGEDAHRRSVYTFIRRTSGYPSFQTFDAPSREFCTVRRLPTNTPLQALVTLNDPVYIEAATALAKRMLAAGETTDQRIARGWQLATGRPAVAGELSPLLALHREAWTRFTTDPKAAASLGETPELAALTVVANALLNVDAVLTR
jgi:hypothetical protein